MVIDEILVHNEHNGLLININTGKLKVVDRAND
jgi:hypothetical protein